MADFELDKGRFGEFVAAERKRLGLTQKELAQRLFLSDKAVSKWERGLSLPDVALIIPLAEALGVTTTELLEGRRMEAGAGMEMVQVEHLVKKTLSLSESAPERRTDRRRGALTWAGWAGAAALEVMLLVQLGYFPGETVLTLLPLAFLFGGWAWFGARERLPAYYDENDIYFYSDGIFRLSMVGMRFHNGNWPYILRGIRVWSVATMLGVMPLSIVLEQLAGKWAGEIALLLIFLVGLFLPVYILGKRYE